MNGLRGGTSLWTRTKKFIREHKIGAVAVAGAFLVGGIAGYALHVPKEIVKEKIIKEPVINYTAIIENLTEVLTNYGVSSEEINKSISNLTEPKQVEKLQELIGYYESQSELNARNKGIADERIALLNKTFGIPKEKMEGKNLTELEQMLNENISGAIQSATTNYNLYQKLLISSANATEMNNWYKTKVPELEKRISDLSGRANITPEELAEIQSDLSSAEQTIDYYNNVYIPQLENLLGNANKTKDSLQSILNATQGIASELNETIDLYEALWSQTNASFEQTKQDLESMTEAYNKLFENYTALLDQTMGNTITMDKLTFTDLYNNGLNDTDRDSIISKDNFKAFTDGNITNYEIVDINGTAAKIENHTLYINLVDVNGEYSSVFVPLKDNPVLELKIRNYLKGG